MQLVVRRDIRYFELAVLVGCGALPVVVHTHSGANEQLSCDCIGDDSFEMMGWSALFLLMMGRCRLAINFLFRHHDVSAVKDVSKFLSGNFVENIVQCVPFFLHINIAGEVNQVAGEVD